MQYTNTFLEKKKRHWNKCKLNIHLRKMNKNIYALIPVQNYRWPGPIPAARGQNWSLPWTRCHSIGGRTHTHTPHTHSDWGHADTDSPKVYIFGMWEETTVLHRHRENMKIPDWQWPWPGINFFPSLILWHHSRIWCNEFHTILNKLPL